MEPPLAAAMQSKCFGKLWIRTGSELLSVGEEFLTVPVYRTASDQTRLLDTSGVNGSSPVI